MTSISLQPLVSLLRKHIHSPEAQASPRETPERLDRLAGQATPALVGQEMAAMAGRATIPSMARRATIRVLADPPVAETHPEDPAARQTPAHQKSRAET